MAQPTKPVVSSVWASTATDNVTPTDAFIAAGWPQSTTPPSRGRFNWLLNYLYNGVRYFSRRGIADYDAAETYMTNDKTMGPDGLTYISLVDNNIAHTPSSSPTQWARWGMAKSETDALYTAFSQFSGLLTGSGYLEIPCVVAGVKKTAIIQWGITLCTSANTFYPFTFPIPFPTACFSVMATASNGSSSALACSANAPTLTGVQVTVNNANCNVMVITVGF